jgi:hypothetical protein
VEGPACKFLETQGLLKESGSTEPWIFNPTAEEVVVAAHESTVDQGQGVRPF